MSGVLVESDRTQQRARDLVWWCMGAPALVFVLMNAVLFLLCFVLYFGVAVRVVYAFNTLVMPGLLFASAWLLCRAFPVEVAGERARRVAAVWATLGILLLGVRIYATHIEPRLLQVREVHITSGKLTAPLTILHLSDIQSAGIGAYEQRVFDTIREINPDLVLHTGDLLQPIPPRTYGSELPKAAALFESLDVPRGMYMVQGDTCGPLYSAQPHETGGIAYLHNAEAVIARESDRIRVYGLDLWSSAPQTQARGKVERWLQSDPAAFNIVMGHRPDYILKMNDLAIDLCLAGHTHGGQIRVPFFGPPIIFSHIPRDWARGFREVGNTRLNVSAGIGAEHAHSLPSIRLNCPPEMTVIRVLPG